MAAPGSTAPLAHVVHVREQAAELLERLTADRARLEAVLAEGGRRDQIKWVTGSSALDNAIASTRQMIESMDRILATAPVRADRPAYPPVAEFIAGARDAELAAVGV
jgi:Ni,Fe-hydrogenase III large subunit